MHICVVHQTKTKGNSWIKHDVSFLMTPLVEPVLVESINKHVIWKDRTPYHQKYILTSS